MTMSIEQNRNRAVGAIVISLAFISLLALGTWQVQRMAWKTNLIANIENGLAAEPVPLNDGAAYSEYSRVVVEGYFDHSKEMYLQTINKDGDFGFYVYVPFFRPDKKVILVNRGFVPPALIDPSTRIDGLPMGNVVLSGVLRTSAEKKYFIPDNDIAANRWFYADLTAMSKAAGLFEQNVFPMILEAEANVNATTPPFGGVTRVNIVNNHLGYAVTWFGLAISLLVVVFFYRRKTKLIKGKDNQ